jgi:hypothetical protein
MLGHSDVTVTQRYAHPAESALMKAVSETPGARSARVLRRPRLPGTCRAPLSARWRKPWKSFGAALGI